jgi:hypothetical protein
MIYRVYFNPTDHDYRILKRRNPEIKRAKRKDLYPAYVMSGFRTREEAQSFINGQDYSPESYHIAPGTSSDPVNPLYRYQLTAEPKGAEERQDRGSQQSDHRGLISLLFVVGLAAAIVAGVFIYNHLAKPAEISQSGTTSDSPSAIAASSKIAQSPLDQLTAIGRQDQSAVQDLAEKYWVPILSSKKVGTVDPKDAEFPNQPYTNKMILQNFNYWHSRYASALLLNSSSYSSLTPGYWVIILNRPYSAPGDVISWCKAQGLNDDNCDATLLSNRLPNGPQTYQSW